jgi:methylthioxylose transferase
MKSHPAAQRKPRPAASTKPRPAGRTADLVVAAVALALVAAAAVTAGLLQLLGHPVHAAAAPLFAHWMPHVGPGTPFAIAVAVLVCRYGPVLAARLRWRPLLAASYATALLWTMSLALVDGWQRGVAGRLTTRPEYLTEVPGVTDVPQMLRGFTARILDFQPDSWTTHVSGHPPGALLVFVGLDRLGLAGGAWAGLLCIAIGALTAVAVPETVRLLVSERAGRAAAPFVALFPGAIWVGVSADGLFAGVAATGVAFLAYGLVRRSRPAALVGGLLLAGGAYLSYGLVLMVVIVAAVVLSAHRAVPGAWRTTAWAIPW